MAPGLRAGDDPGWLHACTRSDPRDAFDPTHRVSDVFDPCRKGSKAHTSGGGAVRVVLAAVGGRSEASVPKEFYA